MARKHGKNTVILLAGNDVSAFCKNSEWEREGDDEDTTTYGKDDKVYDPSLRGGKFKADGVYEDGATGPAAVIQPMVGTKVELTRRTEGTGSGLPQQVVDLVVNTYTESNPVGGYIMWSMTGKHSDAVDSTPQA